MLSSYCKSIYQSRAANKAQYCSPDYFSKLPDEIEPFLMPSDVPVCGVYKNETTWTLICFNRVVASWSTCIQRISLAQMEHYCSVGLWNVKEQSQYSIKPDDESIIMGSRNRNIWVSDASTMTQLHSMALWLNRPAIQLGLLDMPSETRPSEQAPSEEEWHLAGGHLKFDNSWRKL